jgi:hypothetical protein
LGFRLAIAVVLFALAGQGPALSATQVECHALFQKADGNGDGVVDGPELKAILAPSATHGLMAEPDPEVRMRPRDFEERCMLDRLDDLAAHH